MTEDAIRTLAYELWEKSTLPKMDAEYYWYLAEELLRAMENTNA